MFRNTKLAISSQIYATRCAAIKCREHAESTNAIAYDTLMSMSDILDGYADAVTADLQSGKILRSPVEAGTFVKKFAAVEAFRVTDDSGCDRTGATESWPYWAEKARNAGAIRAPLPGEAADDQTAFVICKPGGAKPCQIGGWIVQAEDGELDHYNSDAFASLFEPS